MKHEVLASFDRRRTASLPPAAGRTMAPRVVIVDGDATTRDPLAAFLADHGMTINAVASAGALDEHLRVYDCDVVILDLMICGEDGLAVLRALMQRDEQPGIIMFSHVASEIDRIVALEMGADDYVLKDASPREMLAHVRSVLRRRRAAEAALPPTEPAVRDTPVRSFARAHFAGWTLDTRSRALTAPTGEAVPITNGEFAMLTMFVADPQTVHPREHLARATGRELTKPRARTIDVNLSRFRRKLAEYDDTELIRTVRGGGYLFLPIVSRDER